MKIILTVEGHPHIKQEFEYSYHWRWKNIIFIQGDTENAFITFEDDNAEEVCEMISDAYEFGEDDFTLNFPKEHASAFERPKKKNEVLVGILEKMND